MGFNTGNGGNGNSPLSSSSDVAFSNPATNELLYYDANAAKWKNGLNGAFVRVRVWTGSSYPTRVAGASNLFIGPNDPGLAMNSTQDIWAGPSTSLDTVTAAALNTNSSLFSAIQSTSGVTRRFISAAELAPIDNRPASFSNFSSNSNSSSGLPAWVFAPNAVSLVGTLIETPAGWSKVRVRLVWSHNASSTNGSVTWLVRGYAVPDGTVVDAGGTSIQANSAVPDTRTIKSTALSNIADVDSNGDLVRINIARLGNNDSFGDSAYLVGLWVERAS